jgi:mono/diheme cytochrome c family protein
MRRAVTRKAGVTLAFLLVGGTAAWAAENVASAVATPQTTTPTDEATQVPQAPEASPEAAAAQSAERGRAIFEKRCVTCHGASGKGDGRVAKLFKPKPSDLTASKKSDTYKTEIITKGGASVGRSIMMPSWEAEMSAEQIGDVVAYLAVLAGNGG